MMVAVLRCMSYVYKSSRTSNSLLAQAHRNILCLDVLVHSARLSPPTAVDAALSATNGDLYPNDTQSHHHKERLTAYAHWISH